MRQALRFSVLVFLVAMAVQARLIRPGDLTPTWPLLIAAALGAAFAAVARRQTAQPPDA